MPEVLIVADADHIHHDVEAALAGPDVTFHNLRFGQEVLPWIEMAGEPDLAVLDLQVGNMGGMATCMALRLEEGAERLFHVPVIMLLDRDADVFLARRSQAEAWFVKPINPIQLRACADRLIAEEEAKWAEERHPADDLLDSLERGAELESGKSQPGEDARGASVT